eukprot:gb/GECH01011939.1/.p1 GENE.gb/GECH01011939.1/~~gb/GECH01011939.1/.p1  ORF type:complete len:252 (+),score=57.19 gb/GECH01011939.1/:1-756(+)
MCGKRDDIFLLFDVDGTLTLPRKKATEEILNILRDTRAQVVTGIVGGSDLKKQMEQLGNTILDDFDYVFAENGLVAYKDGDLIAKRSIADYLGEEKLQKFVNFTLKEIADLDIPIKRGTFIEFRNGMLNVSPIGRNCSQEEREQFYEYDKEHHIREHLVEKLQEAFRGWELCMSIGGQISFDVFPRGWDKTYCLQHVADRNFAQIHFFGDKTYAGGNDHEIFEDERTVGHTVTSPEETVKILREMMAKNFE